MQKTKVRTLSAMATLTTPGGARVFFGGARIISMKLEEGADEALLGGERLAATIELRVVAPDSDAETAADWLGASLNVTCVLDGAGHACGRFWVDGVFTTETRGVWRLTGSDGLNAALVVPFADAGGYPKRLDALFESCLEQSGLRFEGTLPNAATPIETAPDFQNVTVGKVLGHIGRVVGAAWRLNRQGQLTLLPLKWERARCITPSEWMSLTERAGLFGPVGAVELTDRDGNTLSRVGDSGVCLKIEEDALFAACPDAAATLLEHVQGLTLRGFSFRWQGTPDLMAGQGVTLITPDGRRVEGTVTKQTLRLEDGFSSDCVCAVPSETTVPRAVTGDGRLNAAMLTGSLGGTLLAAKSVGTAALADGAVTAEKLSAEIVSGVSVAALTKYLNALTEEQRLSDPLAMALRRAVNGG